MEDGVELEDTVSPNSTTPLASSPINTPINPHPSSSSAINASTSSSTPISDTRTTSRKTAKVVERGWFGLVALQWWLLFKKNFILASRGKKLLVFQFIAPILFMLILYAVQTYVNDATKSTDEGRRILYPEFVPVRSIPRCNIGRNKGEGNTCMTIMYAPMNSVTDLLVSRAANTSNIPASEVMGFATGDDMDDYILGHQNRTQGGYLFVNWTAGIFEYAIQFNNTNVCRNGITNNCRYPSYDIVVPMQVAMDREIIRYQLEQDGKNADSLNYTVGTMQLPQPVQHYDSGVVPIFLLAAVMFNFVVLAKSMTFEKETKLFEGMRMMGLKELPYWLSWFSYYLIVMTVGVFMLFVAGHIFSFELFTENDFGVIFVTLWLFSISMICFAFFLVSLSSNSQTISTVGFILWVVFCAVFISINDNVYSNDGGTSESIQNIVSLVSAFAFSKGISDLNDAGYDGGIKWSQRGDRSYSPFWPATKVWNFLILDSFIYLFLAWYISNVFPGIFGVPKPFYFFLTRTYWVGSQSKKKRAKANEKAYMKAKKVQKGDIEKDTDVLAEEQAIEQENFLPETVVVLHNMVKIFGRGKKQFVAVKGISMTMQNNQLFCLLGPNGAGKTTTFNMMTGLFPASAGEAEIFGYSTADEMDKIRKVMGVCPQHDLLWDDMTGRQHLEFFCRFKNMQGDQIADEVEYLLAEVGLTKIADVPTSAYSGGEKRRLSVALATSGDPKIVFMDEPTTGMDPVSRHQVWDIISRAKQGRVVILTTHSMEEADRLSDRIGIVAHGQLRCLGTNIHLKHKFGLGYQLNIFYPPDHTKVVQNLKEYVTSELPEWRECIEAANTITPGTVIINIPHEMAGGITTLLRNLEDKESELGISEISMNLSSLEEVFLKIASESLNETSISLEDIKNADESLARMMNRQSGKPNEETPFVWQIEAMTRKVLASYKHGWKGLLAQFFIMLLLVLVMLALGLPDVTDVKEDLHPSLLPPPFTRLNPPPLLTIPFTTTGPPINSLGSCCSNNSGLLGNIDFSIQNETTTEGNSLGMYFPTDAFTFVPYAAPVDMYHYLYDNNKKRLTTGYVFNAYNVDDKVILDAAAMRNVTEPYAVMGYIGLLANAFYRSALNSSYSLTLRIKDFPAEKHSEKSFEGSSEATWVVLGCSFFMVQILSYVVREKQQRQRYLMKMSGLRMSVYWIVMFWIHFVIYTILLMFFYALSAATLMPYFSSNSGQIIVSDYFVFAFNQIALAFLISSFSTNAHTIALGAYIYIVALVVATSYINPVFADEKFYTKDSVLYGTAIIPQIAFGRVTSILLYHFFPDRVALKFEQVADMPHLKYMFVIMFLTGVGFLILHQYFERVFPSEFGKSLHPAFFVMPKFWRDLFSKDDDDTKSIAAYKGMPVNEPADVSTERATALSSPGLPLCVPGISKVFKDDNAEKIAVNNLAFSVGKAECFGVLGPNGGGKTTLVNILCGLYTPTSGTAFIDTHNIDTHLELAQRHIGVCPQDSVLFNDLTGREHLMLFGKLRNLQGAALELAVDLALQQVLLTDAQHRQAGGYSGGMKRRLSLAIALIGNPRVVMLDEPSTGVDPFSRRVLWDVIQSYKKYTSIVLITHSMEEAEALCDRVCMVSDGTMRCVGRPIELKARYGVGYNLTIMYKPGMQTSADDIVNFVKTIVRGGKVIQIVSNTIIFSLPKENMRLSELFAAIQERKEELNIADWGLLQSSLEDVLLQATGVIAQ